MASCLGSQKVWIINSMPSSPPRVTSTFSVETPGSGLNPYPKAEIQARLDIHLHSAKSYHCRRVFERIDMALRLVYFVGIKL